MSVGKKGKSTAPSKVKASKVFHPETLDRSLIALPLLALVVADKTKDQRHHVIIDVNLDFYLGRDAAFAEVKSLVEQVEHGGLDEFKSSLTTNYIFANMTSGDVQELARLVHERAGKDGPVGSRRAIHRIWLDQPLGVLTNASVATVKGIAARNAFSAHGDNIVWAVADSGIDVDHPHFQTHETLNVRAPLKHVDLTLNHKGDEVASQKAALIDALGHGTHVAGIIAGELVAKGKRRNYVGEGDVRGAEIKNEPDGKGEILIHATTRRRQEDGEVVDEDVVGLERMTGVAPKAKILSIKVLDDNGNGLSSNLIAAIAVIQKANGNGRRLLIHGLNMSVGYDFDPEWFACGQSPLCVEVDRLVKSGVCVVVAAGNTGYGWVQLPNDLSRNAGLDLTINDPGNAELAITVGSTHRDMPHVYGVSYFSSKGPTGDGRPKPDLVAPGEKILSCKSSPPPDVAAAAPAPAPDVPLVTIGRYREDSGTSMAAPHVSGAIAAFLSVRREFIGKPEEVKRIFTASATDLRRDRNFQGAGLLDLMRALQSV